MFRVGRWIYSFHPDRVREQSFPNRHIRIGNSRFVWVYMGPGGRRLETEFTYLSGSTNKQTKRLVSGGAYVKERTQVESFMETRKGTETELTIRYRPSVGKVEVLQMGINKSEVTVCIRKLHKSRPRILLNSLFTVESGL